MVSKFSCEGNKICIKKELRNRVGSGELILKEDIYLKHFLLGLTVVGAIIEIATKKTNYVTKYLYISFSNEKFVKKVKFTTKQIGNGIAKTRYEIGTHEVKFIVDFEYIDIDEPQTSIIIDYDITYEEETGSIDRVSFEGSNDLAALFIKGLTGLGGSLGQ